MAIITFREALRQALDEEMARDEKLFFSVKKWLNIMAHTRLVRDCWRSMEHSGNRYPISEEGFTVRSWSCTCGLRPVVEWMTFNFSLQAIDQVYSNAARCSICREVS
jgi:pyruvate dehydrogenase E1 component beta subunit